MKQNNQHLEEIKFSQIAPTLFNHTRALNSDKIWLSLSGRKFFSSCNEEISAAGVAIK